MQTSTIPGQQQVGGGDTVARQAQVRNRLVAATVAGNALEFYDFVSYAFFAVYIGKTFFPVGTAIGSLLLSVAVFGVGFVSRPLGGILIGAYADRVGRKPALLLTIVLITAGTLGLAVTPSYASIGMAAPVIVVVCRLVQGLAFGGDIGPSSAFLIEIAPPGKRGLYGSWQLASQGIASLLAGGLGMMLTSSMAPADLEAWGWRLPFMFGLLLIPIALYLRRTMPETLGQGAPAGVVEAPARLRDHGGLVMLGILIVMGGTISTYVGNYMTTYAITTLKLSPTISMSATLVVGASTLVFALVGGFLSDRYGRKPVMLVPRVLSALLVYPAFMLLAEQRTTTSLLCVSGLLAALTGISGGATLAAIPELLPRRIRASGMSIAYAVGVALFGGTTQLVITWLIATTGNPASPAWYVAITSVITALAMLAMPEGRDRALSH